MPTTARGIWTPSDTDAVDFTTHLATMANTIETALNSGANASNGTAAQRAAFLSTATAGWLWQDTDGIRMIWKRGASAWEPAVWRWAGTTAQMNAFTQAPNGFEWFNTTDNGEYVRLSGAWAPVLPDRYYKLADSVSGLAGGAAWTTLALPSRPVERRYHVTARVLLGNLNTGSVAAPALGIPLVSAGTVTNLLNTSIPLGTGQWGGVMHDSIVTVPAATAVTVTLRNGPQGGMILRGVAYADPVNMTLA